MITAFWVIMWSLIAALVIATLIAFYIIEDDTYCWEGWVYTAVICPLVAVILGVFMIVAYCNMHKVIYTPDQYNLIAMSDTVGAKTKTVEIDNEEYLEHKTLWKMEQWTYYVHEENKYEKFKIDTSETSKITEETTV